MTPKQWDKLIEGAASKNALFNKKPIRYWRAQADELVMELLVRAAYHQTDEHSIIGHLARKRLVEIAKAENKTLFKKILQERQRSMAGFKRIMREIFS